MEQATKSINKTIINRPETNQILIGDPHYLNNLLAYKFSNYLNASQFMNIFMSVCATL